MITVTTSGALVLLHAVTAVLRLLATWTQHRHTFASLDILAGCIFIFMSTLTQVEMSPCEYIYIGDGSRNILAVPARNYQLLPLRP